MHPTSYYITQVYKILMMRSRLHKLGLILPIISLIIWFWACSNEENRINEAQNIVINEIMPANQTGLMGGNKKPADWLELKNTSKDSISLKDLQLVVRKLDADNINDTDSTTNPKPWIFPDVKIAPGECLLIFAEKSKTKKSSSEEPEEKDGKQKILQPDINTKYKNWISADLKLPKKGGVVQLLSPKGTVIKEVKYNALKADQSLALQNDSTYVATYWQSPGFENDRKGYESAMAVIESQRDNPLKIWEVVSRSQNSNQNWVELKNTGDKEIDLSEYKLAKKVGKKGEGWQLPAQKLAPGEFITIQMAGRDASPNNKLQASFKLGDNATVVLLKGNDFVDGVNAKNTIRGGSIGRADGKKGFLYFNEPTRNGENSENGKRFIADKPEFDLKPGIYSDTDSIYIRLKNPYKQVRYTLDGSKPTSSSPVFKDSMLITKNTVLRAFCEGDSVSLKSDISTSTYLLGVEHTIPVVNVSLNTNDMYDHNNGIYVEGPGYTKEWPHKGANYWKKMVKDAHVEIFDGGEGLSQECGFKIFGGFSRAEAKKSFTVKFKSVYGESKVDYDFFGDGEPVEIEDLVLRSGSQDWNRCMLRDEFFTSLVQQESPSLITQKYRPVALYINAVYFGLYYIREKIDRHFVSRKLNVPEDSINIVMSIYTEEGPREHYQDLMKYVTSNDLSKSEHYDYIKKNVDLQGLIDYKLGEIFSGNRDVGNIRYIRSFSPESDKKWRFVFYDLDASWSHDMPAASYYLDAGSGNSLVGSLNRMIDRLLQNPEFRDLFLQRLSHHLTNTFSVGNSTAVFDSLVEQIRPEMQLNCKRWPQLSYTTWEKNINDFRMKLETRPQTILNDIRNHLKVTPEENKKYFSHLGY